MFRRAAFALALLVLGGDAASAVTFSASFEKTLASGLVTLAQDVQAQPKLQAAVVGVPLDVAGWAALAPGDIVAKLTLLSTQKADAVQYLMMDAPASSAQVEKFMADSNELILAFADAIESGEYATATEPVALQGGAAPSAGAPAAGGSPATPSSAGAPGAPVSAPASTPASAPTGAAGAVGAAPGKSVSGPASAPVAAPGPAPAAAGAASSPASAGVSVQGATASKSTTGTTTGVATGISIAASTPTSGAASAGTATAPAAGTPASTPASTNSTGVSAVSLSLEIGGNSTDGSSTGEAASVDANSTKSTPVQALTPTAGSASLAVSAVASAVVFAACALAV